MCVVLFSFVGGVCYGGVFFFFKQKTAYEMRISDWSSDVCSSDLAATSEWLEGDMAKAFVRAYRRTRAYLNEAPAAEIARAEKRFFPQIDEAVLADCIAPYQQPGCWTPQGEITQPPFEATPHVFAYNRLIKRPSRHDPGRRAPP